jgi:hypothetical protein
MRIKDYAGQGKHIADLPEIVQRAYHAWHTRVLAYYGQDSVDYQITLNEIRLCEATAEHVYSKFTPTKLKYKRGSRPELEKVLDKVLAGATGERERVLAIFRFVRDLYKGKPAGFDTVGDAFHGGTEEEVIKKFSRMCNEQSRVFCVLCQIAGIPARYIGHHIGGHATNEAFVEGRWAYFDNRGKYFVKPDGTLASAWEVWRDLSIIDRQPPEVRREICPDVDYLPTRRYFAPIELIVVSNYFAWDRAKYGYGWIWNTPELRANVTEARKEWPEELSHENVHAMIRGEKPWPK